MDDTVYCKHWISELSASSSNITVRGSTLDVKYIHDIRQILTSIVDPRIKIAVEPWNMYSNEAETANFKRHLWWFQVEETHLVSGFTYKENKDEKNETNMTWHIQVVLVWTRHLTGYNTPATGWYRSSLWLLLNFCRKTVDANLLFIVIVLNHLASTVNYFLLTHEIPVIWGNKYF